MLGYDALVCSAPITPLGLLDRSAVRRLAGGFLADGGVLGSAACRRGTDNGHSDGATRQLSGVASNRHRTGKIGTRDWPGSR